MSATTPTTIRSQPGVKRDGTRFEGDFYTDAGWCRFQRGLPRKMGGYSSLTASLPEFVYGMTSFSRSGTIYQHLGSATKLTQVRSNYAGNFMGQSDRTPVGLVTSPNLLWQFDHMVSPIGTTPSLLAHGAQNLAEIDNSTESNIYFGDTDGSTPLTATGMDPQSGGIVVLYPYLLTYGNAGRIDQSAAGDFMTPNPDSSFVTAQKIVKGLSLRGGGGGPSGLFWSLDSLIRATFNTDTPGQPNFAYDTIAEDISILSSRGVIANDGIYYWVGVDRFLMFNGVVREIPNSLNVNFFFENLNFTQRQKVFAYKVPRFGEIWWCFPFGSSTECNHAVIYNYRENTWYDTPLPNSGRTDGLFAKVYQKPFMTGIDLNVLPTPGFVLWQHETGKNEILGSRVEPIRSFFQTGTISLIDAEKPLDKSLRVERVEPDFVQVGPMNLTITGQANARSMDVDTATKTYPAVATSAEDQTVTFKDAVRRLLRFRFESNAVDGDYQTGECVAHVAPNDGRVTG